MVEYASWHWSFYIQGFCLVPCAVCFQLSPKKYFDIDYTIKARAKCAHTVQQKLYKQLNLQTVGIFGGAEGGSLASRRVSGSLTTDRSVSLSNKFETVLDRLTTTVFKDLP